MIQVNAGCLSFCGLVAIPGKFFIYLGGVGLLDLFCYAIHSCWRGFLSIIVFSF